MVLTAIVVLWFKEGQLRLEKEVHGKQRSEAWKRTEPEKLLESTSNTPNGLRCRYFDGHKNGVQEQVVLQSPGGNTVTTFHEEDDNKLVERTVIVLRNGALLTEQVDSDEDDFREVMALRHAAGTRLKLEDVDRDGRYDLISMSVGSAERNKVDIRKETQRRRT